MPAGELFTRIERIKEKIRDLRREFHRYPETAFEEKKTSARIARTLGQLGLKVKTGIAETGVIGILQGKKKGKTIALRGDMDAVPINEENAVSYRSRHKGIMHACGHDGHMSIVLGAAIILSEVKKDLRGQVKFIFQPAEEFHAQRGTGGAQLMIKEGVLQNPSVDAILGIHLWPNAAMGKIGIRKELFFAAMDRFEIKIKGKGGHAIFPHQCIDALSISHQIYNALQIIVTKEVDPQQPALLQIGEMKAGTAYNVVAGEAELTGTVRTFKSSTQRKLISKMKKLIKAITHSNGAKYIFNYQRGYPSVINNSHLSEMVASAARKILPERNIFQPEVSMAGEDFAFFQKKVPGAYILLGTRTQEFFHPLHSPRFNFDEKVLLTGIHLFVQSVLDFLH